MEAETLFKSLINWGGHQRDVLVLILSQKHLFNNYTWTKCFYEISIIQLRSFNIPYEYKTENSCIHVNKNNNFTLPTSAHSPSWQKLRAERDHLDPWLLPQGKNSLDNVCDIHSFLVHQILSWLTWSTDGAAKFRFLGTAKNKEERQVAYSGLHDLIRLGESAQLKAFPWKGWWGKVFCSAIDQEGARDYGLLEKKIKKKKEINISN